jgi:hypothetical protein
MDAVFHLISHTGNCHGEWHLILPVLGSLPFIGAWFRGLHRKFHHES